MELEKFFKYSLVLAGSLDDFVRMIGICFSAAYGATASASAKFSPVEMMTCPFEIPIFFAISIEVS